MLIGELTKSQRQLRKRIIEISYKRKLSHLGSCLSAVDLIDAIYKIKKPSEKFILSNGHAGIALYVVMQKAGLLKESDLLSFNIHPDRNEKKGIYVSTGSLGQGLPIAVGMALSDRNKNVYCLTSDGEFAEGSMWESLRVVCDQRLANLKILVNANGWGAYGNIETNLLSKRIQGFGFDIKRINGHNLEQITSVLKNLDGLSIIFAETTVEQMPFLRGQDAHYYIMKSDLETAEDWLGRI